MVTINAGFSQEANKRLEEIARAGCPVDLNDPLFSEYFYCVNDARKFTDVMASLMEFIFMGDGVRREERGLDYSYLPTQKKYYQVSRIDVSLKTPESLGRKLRLKEKTDPDYAIEDVGRVRLVVRDDIEAFVVFYGLKRAMQLLENKGCRIKGEKDYVRNPKEGGYKALHLKLTYGNDSNKVCEVQIVPKDVYDRLPEMHAEYKAGQERQLAESAKN
jgi:hypothetical protein